MEERAFYSQQLSRLKHQKDRYIPIKGFELYNVAAGFTTRFGGYSKKEFESLNLNFFREDDPSLVMKNFEQLSADLGVDLEDMVLSKQVHSSRVMRVSEKHRGMGILKERSYGPVDGLTTNRKGLMLLTYYADCVPLYFYDPIREAICLSHSGWKGTLLDIAGESIQAMKAEYGSNPADIRVSFGPHIGNCCFEVGSDVADDFFNTFSWSRQSASQNDKGKWMLNLEAIITGSLKQHGVKKENITGCSICTKCESQSFFSHRGSGGKTGTGAAFLMMRN